MKNVLTLFRSIFQLAQNLGGWWYQMPTSKQANGGQPCGRPQNSVQLNNLQAGQAANRLLHSGHKMGKINLIMTERDRRWVTQDRIGY